MACVISLDFVANVHLKGLPNDRDKIKANPERPRMEGNVTTVA